MYSFTKLETDKVIISEEIKIIKKSEYSYHLDGENIIQEARLRAQKIESKADEIAKDAFDSGYASGLSEGKKDQSKLLVDTVFLCQKYIESLNKDIEKIVMDCTKKIIGEYPKEDIVLKQIELALKEFNSNSTIKLIVSDSQYQMVDNAMQELIYKNKKIKSIDVIKDSKISNGDCILESPAGSVHLSLESQIVAIEKAINCELYEI